MEILFFKKNPLQDSLSSLNAVISTNERHWIITGHVTFKLRYNQIYQLKTPKTTKNISRIQLTLMDWSGKLRRNRLYMDVIGCQRSLWMPPKCKYKWLIDLVTFSRLCSHPVEEVSLQKLIKPCWVHVQIYWSHSLVLHAFQSWCWHKMEAIYHHLVLAFLAQLPIFNLTIARE